MGRTTSNTKPLYMQLKYPEMVSSSHGVSQTLEKTIQINTPGNIPRSTTGWPGAIKYKKREQKIYTKACCADLPKSLYANLIIDSGSQNSDLITVVADPTILAEMKADSNHAQHHDQSIDLNSRNYEKHQSSKHRKVDDEKRYNNTDFQEQFTNGDRRVEDEVVTVPDDMDPLSGAFIDDPDSSEVLRLQTRIGRLNVFTGQKRRTSIVSIRSSFDSGMNLARTKDIINNQHAAKTPLGKNKQSSAKHKNHADPKIHTEAPSPQNILSPKCNLDSDALLSESSSKIESKSPHRSTHSTLGNEQLPISIDIDNHNNGGPTTVTDGNVDYDATDIKTTVLPHAQQNSNRSSNNGKWDDEESWSQWKNICGICYDFLPETVAVHTSCNHKFCRDCIATWFVSAKPYNTRVLLECPDYDCHNTFSDQMAEEILGPREYRRLLYFRSRDNHKDKKNFRWCTKDGCWEEIGLWNGVSAFLTCENCSTRVCGRCGEYYDPPPCLDSATSKLTAPTPTQHACPKLTERKQRKLKSTIWKMFHTKKCPVCRVNIERDEGCAHMNCPICDTHFCWVCKGRAIGYDSAQTRIKRKCVCRKFTNLAVGCGLILASPFVLVIFLLGTPLYVVATYHRNRYKTRDRI